MNMLDSLYIRVSQMFRNFMENEDGAVDIVAIVVLIGIAVLVAIVFRKQITNLIETLFTKIEGTATGAIETSPSGP